ncbi:chlorohydrolase [Streptococcus pneumoniae]|nr:chlorohydrolase [Streptococcus pneumoniae]
MSTHCFEVVDRTEEPTYGKATLTRFEEIFEEYETKRRLVIVPASF